MEILGNANGPDVLAEAVRFLWKRKGLWWMKM